MAASLAERQRGSIPRPSVCCVACTNCLQQHLGGVLHMEQYAGGASVDLAGVKRSYPSSERANCLGFHYSGLAPQFHLLSFRCSAGSSSHASMLSDRNAFHLIECHSIAGTIVELG
jgi:hypothetical protein